MHPRTIGVVFIALAVQCVIVSVTEGIIDEGILPILAVLLGFVGFGYLVGNRINPSPPAE